MGTYYKHLSCKERTLIQLSLEQGCTLRVIAPSVAAPRRGATLARNNHRKAWARTASPCRALVNRTSGTLCGGYRSPSLRLFGRARYRELLERAHPPHQRFVPLQRDAAVDDQRLAGHERRVAAAQERHH